MEQWANLSLTESFSANVLDFKGFSRRSLSAKETNIHNDSLTTAMITIGRAFANCHSSFLSSDLVIT